MSTLSIRRSKHAMHLMQIFLSDLSRTFRIPDDTCMQIFLSDLSRTFRIPDEKPSSIDVVLLKTEGLCRHCRYEDQACNAFNAMFVDTVNTIEDRGLMLTLSIRRSKHAMHLMLCLSTLSILLKTEGLCRHCRYEDQSMQCI